jgi:hypothetical protein
MTATSIGADRKVRPHGRVHRDEAGFSASGMVVDPSPAIEDGLPCLCSPICRYGVSGMA